MLLMMLTSTTTTVGTSLRGGHDGFEHRTEVLATLGAHQALPIEVLGRKLHHGAVGMDPMAQDLPQWTDQLSHVE